MNIYNDADGVELGTVNNEEVLQLLECPVCLDHITPPMKQCIKGHLVCNECFPRLPHCPTCRSPMNQERNLAIEQIARLLKYPCRYYPMGCREAFILSKKGAHEQDCPYLQLKCPFHGQCAFNGSLKDVVPHLASEHAVTPVPVQPNGTLFYRAKHFYRRNIWTLIYQWDGNLFRFIVKRVHSSAIGRNENCNMLIAHVQYIGAESMASRYAYQISLFDTDSRQTGHKFEGLVTSTMKPLESQCSKEADIFVTTFHQAKNYTDQWANLNFIITMKKLEEDLATPPSGSTTSVTAPTPMESTPSTSSSTATPTPAPTSTPAAPVASSSS